MWKRGIFFTIKLKLWQAKTVEKFVVQRIKKIKDGFFLEAFVEQPLSMTGQGKYMLC